VLLFFCSFVDVDDILDVFWLFPFDLVLVSPLTKPRSLYVPPAAMRAFLAAVISSSVQCSSAIILHMFVAAWILFIWIQATTPLMMTP
jgi:hypothetical protein